MGRWLGFSAPSSELLPLVGPRWAAMGSLVGGPHPKGRPGPLFSGGAALGCSQGPWEGGQSTLVMLPPSAPTWALMSAAQPFPLSPMPGTAAVTGPPAPAAPEAGEPLPASPGAPVPQARSPSRGPALGTAPEARTREGPR